MACSQWASPSHKGGGAFQVVSPVHSASIAGGALLSRLLCNPSRLEEPILQNQVTVSAIHYAFLSDSSEDVHYEAP